jgi:predicted nuclease of predicted toxin-antitoxin system
VQILVDENIPRRTVVRLRELGHDVLDIRGTLREGMKDELLWELAQKEERLLISTDRRFLRYWNVTHSGALVVLLSQSKLQTIHAKIMQTLDQFTPEEWRELLVVVRDTFQSIRRPRTRDEKANG